MAKLEMKIDKKFRNQITLQVDMAEVRREYFGIFDWRKRLAMFFISLAVMVLGCNVEIENG